MIAIIAGTRPEVIKLAPVIRGLRELGMPVWFIHTGQHWDALMKDVFLEAFHVTPDIELKIAVGGSEASRLGALVGAIGVALSACEPRAVVVQGDTLSALAGALATRSCQLPLAHVEAGLRTVPVDFEMFEERARTLIDTMSHDLFAPHRWADENLRQEDMPKAGQRLIVTGNTIADVVRLSGVQRTLDGPDVLVTIHRRENEGKRLTTIVEQVAQLEQSFATVWPVHPRLRGRDLGRTLESWTDPLPYDTFLRTLAGSRLVLTDSGGVQEECALLGVPCLTVRDSTERPETIACSSGVNALVQPEDIVAAVQERLAQQPVLDPQPCLYGRDAGVKIARALIQRWG